MRGQCTRRISIRETDDEGDSSDNNENLFKKVYGLVSGTLKQIQTQEDASNEGKDDAEGAQGEGGRTFV